MCTNTLFGASEEDQDKKLNRITISLNSDDFELIEKIAFEKNITRSEVVCRLIRPTLSRIAEQEELITINPKLVAFDLITSTERN
ncbi:hypothetical protein [Sulfurospirillum sp. UCH001]|uniref:hypothetical protein n=1 Tax=Sulfurospirillum sp. UCH001 TaxID=1581011 RepID=UPI00082FD748|nr:hypothetical protein [Sulfurospirillum sp. UCH001]